MKNKEEERIKKGKGFDLMDDISVIRTLMPTEKHGDTTAKNVEFGSLFLHQMTALFPERLAIWVAFIYLSLLHFILFS